MCPKGKRLQTAGEHSQLPGGVGELVLPALELVHLPLPLLGKGKGTQDLPHPCPIEIIQVGIDEEPLLKKVSVEFQGRLGDPCRVFQPLEAGDTLEVSDQGQVCLSRFQRGRSGDHSLVGIERWLETLQFDFAASQSIERLDPLAGCRCLLEGSGVEGGRPGRLPISQLRRLGECIRTVELGGRVASRGAESDKRIVNGQGTLPWVDHASVGERMSIAGLSQGRDSSASRSRPIRASSLAQIARRRRPHKLR